MEINWDIIFKGLTVIVAVYGPGLSTYNFILRRVDRPDIRVEIDALPTSLHELMNEI